LSPIYRVLRPSNPQDHRLNVRWAYRFQYTGLVLAGLGFVLALQRSRIVLAGVFALVAGLLCLSGFFWLRAAGIRAYVGHWSATSYFVSAAGLLTLAMAVLESLVDVAILRRQADVPALLRFGPRILVILLAAILGIEYWLERRKR